MGRGSTERINEAFPHVSVVILTKNEEEHILRAIKSVDSIASDVLVVDSGSTDETVKRARQAGARVLTHDWVNHAVQMNWSFKQIAPESDWVLRLDADEVVTPALAEELRQKLQHVAADVDGVETYRRIHFLGQPIRWGGIFPTRVLRLVRNGKGRSENRWMDEHLVVPGQTVPFQGEIIDKNLKPLTWWIEKHNNYASREAIELLNLKYGFLPADTIPTALIGTARTKRWIKEVVYARLPKGLRAFTYFFYRYVLRLGFLDGKAGGAFHILQGFWYRYLVDMKLYETELHMRRTSCSPEEAILDVLGIEVRRG